MPHDQHHGPKAGSGTVREGPPPDGLGRSFALLKAFRCEQTDPDLFYGLVARDLLGQVAAHVDVSGRVVLDIGAGRPQFAHVFCQAGAQYVAVDVDARELADHSAVAVASRGEALAVRSGSVDVSLAINVFEHVPRPRLLGEEMVRVTRPGGLLVVSYTNWLSPWGGHETSPYHYLGGTRAIRRYERRYGRSPKNRVDDTLFRVSVAAGLRWARQQDGVHLITAQPRYYPSWTRGLLRVPGLRELATWNLLMILRRA